MHQPMQSARAASTSTPERMIGVTELAEHLQLTEETIRRLARSNTIPSLKVARRLRFNLSDVLTHLENRK